MFRKNISPEIFPDFTSAYKISSTLSGCFCPHVSLNEEKTSLTYFCFSDVLTDFKASNVLQLEVARR